MENSPVHLKPGTKIRAIITADKRNDCLKFPVTGTLTVFEMSTDNRVLQATYQNDTQGGPAALCWPTWHPERIPALALTKEQFFKLREAYDVIEQDPILSDDEGRLYFDQYGKRRHFVIGATFNAESATISVTAVTTPASYGAPDRFPQFTADLAVFPKGFRDTLVFHAAILAAEKA